MNRKQITTLLVIVVVLGAAWLLVAKREDGSSSPRNASLGAKLLGEFPVNDITRVSIKEGTNQVNLVKKDIWRVQERHDYPASYSEISDALIKLKDLKIVQSEQVGSSQLPRLGLAAEGSNAAAVVEFRGAGDKLIRTLLLGKKHMRKSNRPSPFGDMGDEGIPDGRYVKVSDSPMVATISDPLSNLEPKPEQWLNKDFFKVEKVRAIAVTYPVETNSWKLSRETESGEWKLAEAKAGEQLDSAKTSALSNPLSSPSFSDVAELSKATECGLDKPTLVTLDTFDDFTYAIKVGQKTNDNIPIILSVAANLPKERVAGKDEKPEDKEKLDKEFKDKQKKLEEKLAQEKNYEKWIYLVSSWTLDSVLKERAQLLAEKKEEPKPEAATNAPPAAATSEPAGEAPAAAAKQ